MLDSVPGKFPSGIGCNSFKVSKIEAYYAELSARKNCLAERAKSILKVLINKARFFSQSA